MATVAKSLSGLDLFSVDFNFGLYIEGTNLNDSLYGTAYADEIHGRFGNDFLSGGGGDDLLLALHARRSFSSIRRFSDLRPAAPVVVAHPGNLALESARETRMPVLL